ncbi:hypothetical protein LHJ74_25195 [Streptomyces sp. N2-109]|uniref:Uncharacterized protein n=1 Tax=Streptomyces gossypii TaxID=2883101 RepID=A0ABT2JZ89_9ACTN|nr:hypothetical protein [Streptomyces gossypii]MCT2593161.1 hypothetical protein [Streptomyces gossypii]
MGSACLSPSRRYGPRTARLRRTVAVVGSVLCLLGLPMTAAAPAALAAPATHAADDSSALLLCHGTVNVSYDPPLTYIPKPTTVSATEDFNYCPTGGVTGGSASASYETTSGCTSLRLFVVSSTTYHWDSGQTSVVTYTTTAIERLLNGTVLVTEQGTVTSGFGEGRTAVYQMVLPQLDLLACVSGGVDELTGSEVLTFV